MEKLILDASVFGRFPGWDRQLEICDEEGRTLGYFLPPRVHHQLLYDWAKNQFSDNERAEARQELQRVGGLSTADAIEFLRGRAGTEDAVL